MLAIVDWYLHCLYLGSIINGVMSISVQVFWWIYIPISAGYKLTSELLEFTVFLFMQLLYFEYQTGLE